MSKSEKCIVFDKWRQISFTTFSLDTQYQRKHVQMLRRKMMSGGGPDGQLNRLRNMNGTGGMMMTEYNPNYEFGGGTCTIQDLKEIPREHLRLVK